MCGLVDDGFGGAGEEKEGRKKERKGKLRWGPGMLYRECCVAGYFYLRTFPPQKHQFPPPPKH